MLIVTAVCAVNAHGQPCDWEPLGSGVAPAADACALLDSGELVVGGRITLAGTLPVNFLAMWDGASWSDVGSGVNGFIRTLLPLPGSEFIAGGQFTQVGNRNYSASLIARWDGGRWHRLGQGLDAGSCRSLARTASGDIIAGGTFLKAGDLPAWCVASWDGSAWTKLGTNTIGGGVSGTFFNITRPTMVNAIVVMPNGDIVVGGDFTHADGVPATGLARWDGKAWHDVGGGTNYVVRDMILLDNGDLVVAGLFGLAGNTPCSGLARWDGSAWHAIGNGQNGVNGFSPFALAKTPTGNIVLAGAFDTISSVQANNIAIWDPVQDVWSPMGSGVFPSIQTSVLDLAVAPNGTIFASGQFISAGGSVDARNIASYACSETCLPDTNGDGVLSPADFSAWISAFNAQSPECDQNGDSLCSPSDFSAWIQNYSIGC